MTKQGPAGVVASTLPEIRVPALLTFAGLVAGIVCGILLRNTGAEAPVLAISGPIGALWLNALKMTVLPLVAGLMFTGVVQSVATASAGPMARRTLSWFAVVLVLSAVLGLVAGPILLGLFPAPELASDALSANVAGPIPDAPGAQAFVASILPENIVQTASEGTMLPFVIFVALFALASTRLGERQRTFLAALFEALAGAMMVVIGWVMALAPIGVFALSLGMAAASGTAAIVTLAHYIAVVSAVGLAVTLGAYAIATTAGGQTPVRFTRAMLPAQAVAISTQSSVASLPAMIASCRKLGLRDSSDEFVLPLAVALFKATSPAMNVALAYYVARMAGIEPGLPELIAAGAVAALVAVGVAGVPSAVSFFGTIAPILLAMGAPLEPLAILIAVEMLPDIVRTLGNVTMNVAIATAVDHRAQDLTTLH